ncbi:MAG: hypothetical protein CM15mP127_12680 [Gammaproteobacteria bacterium]|nr:MAG: hypothetical protein CM15mP127_12680 [Gammaproteobacteria bacterium]
MYLKSRAPVSLLNIQTSLKFFYAISESFASLNDFMTAGGPVLWLIAFLAFLCGH